MTSEHANVRMLANHNGNMNPRGKPEAFTPKENAAMRHVLRVQHERLKAKHRGWTQEKTGQLIGVSQQTAGKLLGHGAAGFSRPTALKLAEMCGFDSPESMLRELGAQADPKEAPTGWAMRDLAVASARRMGYDEEVISRVVAKYGDSRYASMPARWWMDRIVHEAAERDAERAAAEPPPSSNAKAPFSGAASSSKIKAARRRA